MILCQRLLFNAQWLFSLDSGGFETYWVCNGYFITDHHFEPKQLKAWRMTAKLFKRLALKIIFKPWKILQDAEFYQYFVF